jgi:hypothetical protein
MIDWILQNREWIFAGIGVAILSGVVALVKRLLRRSPPNSGLPRGATLQMVIDSAPTIPTPPLPAATAIHPKEIIAAINSAPLLQQSDIAKHYLGIEVEWSGGIISAEKRRDNRVGLVIRPGKPGLSVGVAFDVDPTQYPGLGLLREGDKIRVAGVIDRVGQVVIYLRDVRLLAYGKNAI